ncbi:MAG: DUF58 domain-containing protein [Polyangiaceae bacterium]
MSTQLLDPDFLRRLEALRLQLSSEARSGESGENSASRRGSGAEFREHRPYAPGDDPRRIDWMAYARTGEPLVKLFHHEEDRVVRLLVDTSASLGFGEPSKLHLAQRLAAAFGYLSLTSSERCQVFVAQNAEASALSAVGSSHRGRRTFGELCRELAALKAGGRSDLPRALETTLARSLRPGQLVILSDFLDAGPVLAALSRARASGHEVVLVQILSDEELEPDFEGDFALEDSESGAAVEITADASAVAAYLARLADLIDGLRQWARKHRATYIRAASSAELEPLVRRALAHSID